MHSAANVITCARFALQEMWRLTKTMAEIKCEHWTMRWNRSTCTKMALSLSWTHSLIAHLVRASEQKSVVVGSNPTQATFLLLLLKILQCWIPYVSIHSAANVNTCTRFCIKEMWHLAKAMAKTKCEHWPKRWNRSSSKKLALTASLSQGLIPQLVRASEGNSVVVGLNPTQATFL